MIWLVVCVLVGMTNDCVLSARILAVLPIPFRSHHIYFQAVLKTLAERGHQVVNYSPCALDEPIANYTDVLLDTLPQTSHYMSMERLNKWSKRSSVAVPTILWRDCSVFTQSAFESDKLITLLQSNETFDLVMIEPFFAQEACLCLGHKFGAPVISILPLSSFLSANKVAGNSLSLSYIPDFAFPYSDHMTFYERLLSAFSILYSLHYYYTQHLPAQEALMRKIYNNPTLPPLVDMLHNVSLFLDNAHPFIQYPQPRTPNMVQIGGIHLANESKPLPEDLALFLQDAKDGAIYMSLGSLVTDHNIPQEYFEHFISVFRRLPQRVVWKTAAALSGLPDNVMTVKWAPQQDILGHANLKLFITHGGQLSMYETIDAGVPTVCIPFFGDQRFNCKIYEEKKVGLALPFSSLSEDTIHSSVTKVINTEMYQNNMRRLSVLYKDRPVSAADSLVFWVEYVLRHRGAHHLRPASSAMAWYLLILSVCYRYQNNMRRLSALYKDRPVSAADSLVFWVEYVLRHRGAHHLRPASSAMAWYQLMLLDVFLVIITSLVISFSLLYIALRKLMLLIFVKRNSDKSELHQLVKKQN